MEPKARILELTKTLNEASDAYYNGREEILSNYEWDALFDELVALEEETGIVLPDSPTQRAGYESTSGDREAHEYPALSLAKTKKVSDLISWAGGREVWLSWKLDGLTLVVTYDGGTLSRLMTRGNGIVGTNITYLKNALFGFPQHIPYPGHLVVRGEALITYSDFAALNDLIEDDGEKYANPRNLASGTLNLTDPEAVRKRRVQFRAFTLVHADDEKVRSFADPDVAYDLNRWGDRMNFLASMGFSVVEREKLTAKDLPEAVERWSARVSAGSFDLPVDGLVLVYEDCLYAASGTVTGHHALREGYAFKWEDTAAQTPLLRVEWSCAASTISPVAVFAPVQLEGTTVSRASLCNVSEMKRLGLGESCTLSVIKANKIIPKCIAVSDSKGKVPIPSVCPVCGAPTEIHKSPSGTETLHCTNPSCSAKHLMRFSRFVSKNAADIDGLSTQTLLLFINAGLLHEFSDIYHLPAHGEEICALEGFGEKSFANLTDAIEKSRRIAPQNLLYGLCIPMIGRDAAQKIISSLGWDAFYQRMLHGEDFSDIEGIGPERSASLLAWAAQEENIDTLARLLLELILLPSQTKRTNASVSCSGYTFVITGSLSHYRNRDELKEAIESAGGKVTGSVSSKTNYLINNDAASPSSKNRSAARLGVPVITEEEFMTLFFGKED